MASPYIIERRDIISMTEKKFNLNMFAHRKSLKMFETDFSFHIMSKMVTTTSDITLNHCDCK